MLARIRALAIPPAYTDVWICRDPCGHIQATGRDQKGRKQYRYHKDWHGEQDASKFAAARRLRPLAAATARARSAQTCRRAASRREKVLATVVSLLDRTLIRVGNAEYARGNDSYGLTTLQNRHVALKGAELHFRFKGKSGKVWQLRISDRRIARIVRADPGPARPGPVPVSRRGGPGARRHLGRRQRLYPRDRGRAGLRQGFPHLDRHGAGGARPRRGRSLHLASAKPPRRSGPRCTRWPNASATPSPSAAAAMCIPPSSRAICRASPAPCRARRRDDEGLSAEERAVLRYLDSSCDVLCSVCDAKAPLCSGRVPPPPSTVAAHDIACRSASKPGQLAPASLQHLGLHPCRQPAARGEHRGRQSRSRCRAARSSISAAVSLDWNGGA